jgi:hypothetical protein
MLYIHLFSFYRPIDINSFFKILNPPLGDTQNILSKGLLSGIRLSIKSQLLCIQLCSYTKKICFNFLLLPQANGCVCVDFVCTHSIDGLF